MEDARKHGAADVIALTAAVLFRAVTANSLNARKQEIERRRREIQQLMQQGETQ